VIRNTAEGDTTLVSPFDFDLISADSAGHSLRPKQPGATGLWFRETTPVELVFTQRSSPFRAAVLKKLQEVRNATEKYKELAKEKLAEASEADDIVGGNDTAVKTAQKALDTTITSKAKPEDIQKAQQDVKDRQICTRQAPGTSSEPYLIPVLADPRKLVQALDTLRSLKTPPLAPSTYPGNQATCEAPTAPSVATSSNPRISPTISSSPKSSATNSSDRTHPFLSDNPIGFLHSKAMRHLCYDRSFQPLMTTEEAYEEALRRIRKA
jgi:hypothetical protein